MKTFSQFVSIRKDQELVETILHLGIDSEMLFETAYHIIKSHVNHGKINESALVNDLSEGWYTGLKGVVGGLANGLLGRPARNLAAAGMRIGQKAYDNFKQGYDAIAQPAKIKSAQEDLEKFKQRLQGLGLLGTGMPHDQELSSGLGQVGNILQQALVDLQAQIQSRQPSLKPPVQRPPQANAMDAIKNAGSYPVTNTPTNVPTNAGANANLATAPKA